MELLLGSGASRQKKIVTNGPEFKEVVTVDINPHINADVVHDLNVLPWPFENEQFDEVHAYEVLEHLGQQGDVESFFAHFDEIWRILKPNGVLCASTPQWDGLWAWGDPGHTRIINEGTLVFLDRDRYGKPPMTDYRHIYKGHFKTEMVQKQDASMFFVLRKVDVSRC